MARIGSFDEILRPQAWFDDNAVPEGWVLNDLIGPAQSAITVSPGTGAAIFSGFASTVSVSDNKIVSAGAGVLTLTGFTPSVIKSTVTLTGQISFTGFEPTVSIVPFGIFPGKGDAILVGYSPSVFGGGQIFYRPNKVDTAVSVQSANDVNETVNFTGRPTKVNSTVSINRPNDVDESVTVSESNNVDTVYDPG